ncbi:hypothetical protein V6Z11_D09G215200 [Gossypium hirsutum]
MGYSVKRTVHKLGVPFHNQPLKALQFCEDQRSFTSSCFRHECVIHTFHQIRNRPKGEFELATMSIYFEGPYKTPTNALWFLDLPYTVGIQPPHIMFGVPSSHSVAPCY